MTTTLHLAITAEEHVVEGFLTGGNVSDMTKAGALTAEVFGCDIVEDRGDDSDAHRRAREATNNIPLIPGRKTRNISVGSDTAMYKLRRKIEMFFGKITENGRIPVRYEKPDAAFLAFITLAIIKIKTYL